jgi:serine/threonine-protein phosphatase 2A activator
LHPKLTLVTERFVQVKTWDKVNEGMIKMYKAEVLGKLPVMQHFLFGTILPLSIPELILQPPTPSESSALASDSHVGHAHPHTRHVHPKVQAQLPDIDGAGPGVSVEGGGASQLETGWGDCCGIPVPSAFAAAEDEKRKAAGGVTPNNKPGVGVLNFSRAVRPVPFD